VKRLLLLGSRRRVRGATTRCEHGLGLCAEALCVFEQRVLVEDAVEASAIARVGRPLAYVELGVLAHDYGSIMSMLESMQNSGMFRAELRGQDLEKNDRGTYTEYTFRVIYTPAYSAAAASTGDVAQNGGGQ